MTRKRDSHMLRGENIDAGWREKSRLDRPPGVATMVTMQT